MSSDRQLVHFVSKTKYPKLPEFYLKSKVETEFDDISDVKYTWEEVLWKFWNFYNRLKISTLFVYTFLDTPLVQNTLNENEFANEVEFAKAKIHLASKTINLPYILFPANDTHLPKLIFTEPAKTFMLQSLVSHDICMDKLALELNNIFRLDEDKNFYQVKNSGLLKTFILKLNKCYKEIESILDDIKAKKLLLFGDPEMDDDPVESYAIFFNQFISINNLNTYMEYGNAYNKILISYNKELEAAKKMSKDSDSDEQLEDSFSSSKALVTQSDKVRDKYKKELKAYFFNLLITEMAAFHTFKNNLDMPEQIDPEIQVCMKSLEELWLIEHTDMKLDTEKLLKKREREHQKILKDFTNHYHIQKKMDMIQPLAKNDPLRTQKSREIYYEIREVLNCIHFILLKIIANEYIDPLEHLHDLVSRVDTGNNLSSQKSQSVNMVVAKKANPIIVTRVDPAKKKKVVTKQEKKVQESKASLVSSAASIVKEKELTAQLALAKTRYKNDYADCLKTVNTLDEVFLTYKTEHARVFALLDPLPKDKKIAFDKKLKYIQALEASLQNKKNQLKEDGQIKFHEKEYTAVLHRELNTWQIDICSLYVEIKNILKKLEDNEKAIRKASETKAKSKNELLTEKIQRTVFARARTSSERISDRVIEPSALIRRSSEGLMDNTVRLHNIETPEITPMQSPAITPNNDASDPLDSKIYEVKEVALSTLTAADNVSHQSVKLGLNPKAAIFTPQGPTFFTPLTMASKANNLPLMPDLSLEEKPEPSKMAEHPLVNSDENDLFCKSEDVVEKSLAVTEEDDEDINHLLNSFSSDLEDEVLIGSPLINTDLDYLSIFSSSGPLSQCISPTFRSSIFASPVNESLNSTDAGRELEVQQKISNWKLG